MLRRDIFKNLLAVGTLSLVSKSTVSVAGETFPMQVLELNPQVEQVPNNISQPTVVEKNVFNITPQEILSKHPELIRFIDNPTISMQLAAVKKYGNIIQFIDNPCEVVQCAACEHQGNALVYIKNPSSLAQLIAVNQNGWALSHIKNPTEEMQLAAVSNVGESIQLIENPSKEVQIAAVTKYKYAFQYIKKPCVEALELVLKQDSNAIRYFKTSWQTEHLQNLSLTVSNGESFHCIATPGHKYSDATALLAVELRPKNISLLSPDETSEDIQIAAVTKDPSLIHVIYCKLDDDQFSRKALALTKEWRQQNNYGRVY